MRYSEVSLKTFFMPPLEPSLTHLAIIMDGNRRWATEKGMPKFLGHTEGAKNLKKIAKAAKAFGVRYLTLYTLSTENLKNRSEEELKHLFSLIDQLADYLKDFNEENTSLRIIGNLEGMPEKTQKNLQGLVEATKKNTAMTLALAINYGGRDELVRAFKKMTAEKISGDEISEQTIQEHLDTHDMPDVDLVIRTGGDQRLSNYLPWQTTYAELYFTPIYWPAFSEEDLKTAVEWFYNQKRNKGK